MGGLTIPTPDPFGCGLVCPFRFTTTQDFANSNTTVVVKSDVEELLGIVQGEIPWRQDLGTRLTRLRHRTNTQALGDLARIDVEKAIGKYERRIRLREVSSPKPPPSAPSRREIHVAYTVSGKSDKAVTTF